MSKPRKKVLDNGLTIISVPLKDNPTVTVLVMVEAGTKYETKENNGISHFLEHMCFKGTTHRTSSEITEELDSFGAESNAFTWYEFTGYYAKARKQQFEKLLNVVADIYLHPTFPAEEIEKEKGVIIEEINMYRDLPSRYVHDVLYGLMYPDHAAGFQVLGPKENISAMTREHFTSYYENNYVPNATSVIVAGDIKPRDIFKTIETKFKGLEKSKKYKKQKVKEKQTKPELQIHFKDSDQSHFVIGFRGYKAGDKRNPALDVLATILGQGMSSRLFQKLRDEMGVCYYVQAGTETYTDTGIFKIRSGVDNKRVEEVITVILDEVTKLKKEPVPERELKKAKEFLSGNKIMGLESSDEQAIHYGEQFILHEPLETPEQIVKNIKKVTAKDVQKVAKDIFQNKKMNLAVIGPIKSDASLKKIFTLK